MRIHHLHCGTFCPRSERLVNGRGSLFASGHLVCHCLVIESRDGLVLVDTGLGIRDLVAPAQRIGRSWSWLMRPKADPAQTALCQVLALGFRPDDVRDIIVTHLDFDHAGGLPDFPNARVHVSEPEYQAAHHPMSRLERFRYKPAHWAHQPEWVRYPATGERWFDFEGVRALGDRDSEVLLIPLAGHSRGHCGVAVNTGDGWLLHAGDAYFYRSELETPRRHAPIATKLYERFMQMQPTSRVANQQRLADLLHTHRGYVQILCSHDPEELAWSQRTGSADGLTYPKEAHPATLIGRL